MSGNGLRVLIYRYEGEDYPAAFAMGNDYYSQLIGKESDPLCKNITRLSGLAYDPEVYFNPEATAFSAEEISHFHSATLKTTQKKKKQERIADYYEQHRQTQAGKRTDQVRTRQPQPVCDAGGLHDG